MMKAMKRTVSILLILAALLGLLPTTVFAADVIASGYCGDDTDGDITNLKWTLYSNETMVIEGTGAMLDPYYHHSKPWGVFTPVDKVKKIVLQDGITSIGRQMFQGFSELTEVSVPSSIESIGYRAFEGCTSLTKIVIPASVTKIDAQAFQGCAFTSAGPIGSGCDYEFGWDRILPNAFQGCYKLETAFLSAGISAIGDYAFSGCESLKEINIPDSVRTFGGSSFASCSSIRRINIPEGVDRIPYRLFSNCSSLESIEIPDSVTSIDSLAFEGCSKLKTIKVPGNVTHVGAAFDGCIGLQKLIIPSSVTEAGDKLHRGMIAGASNITSAGPLGSGCSVEFGWDKEIPPYAFYGGSYLENVIIPDGIIKIRYEAFRYCEKLEEIIIPGNVEEIGSQSFLNCENLKSVYFEGNAPYVSASSSYYQSFPNETVLFYIPGTTGWTDNAAYDAAAGTWNGYKLATWGGETELKVISQTPDIRGTLSNSDPTISMTFSHQIESVQAGLFDENNEMLGTFMIGRTVDGKGELVYDLAEGTRVETDVTISGNTLTIDVSDVNWTLGETYFIQMNPKVITFKGTDERISFGGSQWTFTVAGGQSGTFHYKAMCGITEYPYVYDDSWFQNTTTKYNHELAKMSIRVGMAAYRTGPSADSEDGMAHGAGSEYIEALMEDELGFTNLDVYYPSPTRNSIGYAIGSKTIPTGDGGRKSLILVAVRGGNYKTEWAGNFMIGTGEFADGIAGDLHEGFSRAAEQVEDGLASYLRWGKGEGFLLDDCTVWITSYSRGAAVTNLVAKRLDDGNIEGLGTDNVYAYCFACPQNSRASNLTASKYNNIFNIVNPLDFVTMVAMSDWDYGRYGQTVYLPYEEGVSNYSTLKNRMIQEYIKILQKGNSRVSAYEATLQITGQRDMTEGLMNWLAGEFHAPALYTTLYQEALMEIVEAVQLNTWNWIPNTASAIMLLGKIGLIAKNMLSLPDTPLDLIKTVLSTEDNMNAVMAAELFAFGTLESGDFTRSPISYTHYPELYLAWMDSLSGSEIVKIDSTYRKVLVNCPVDVAIYDSNGILVGKVVNRVVQDIENGVSVYIDEDEQIVVSLPSDQEYRLDIIATDNGTVTYTVTEQNLDTSSSDRVVCYPGVAIETGDRLSGTVEDLDTVAVATYSLSQGQQRLKPAVDQTGAAVQEYTVTVTVEGAGTVSGGGSGVYGEFKKLSATPDSGTKFVGWYLDGVLLSNDPEYRVCITKDMELVAKFGEGEQTDFIDVSPSDWFYADVAYVSGKGLMNGTGNGRFSPQESTSRAMIVTILYRMSGEPKVSGGSGFTDVPEGQWYSSAVAWAAEHNIVNGYGNGKFGPNDSITREQLAAILYRYAQFCGRDVTAAADLSGFTDAPQISAWAKTALAWANAEGLINGRTETTVVPAATASRAELAAILHRFCEKIR